MTRLPDIPVLDLRNAAHPAHAALQAMPQQGALLYQSARRRYSALGLRLGEAASRHWLRRNGNPLLAEIGAVARALPGPGGHLLNISYEWGCTCGLDAEAAPVLLRVLDWDLYGLGQALCVLRQQGAAGEWWNIGWPGFAGAITALAPGRFGIAINQPPLAETRLGAAVRKQGVERAAMLADWAAARPATWRARALPPAHLLRHVAEVAPDYATACLLLRDTPIAAAAIFSLVGTQPGEACVIERAPDSAALIEAAPRAVAANQWQRMVRPGAARWRHSADRQALMQHILARPIAPDFGWLEPPVRNEASRLAAVMCPADGRLELLGLEAGEPVTQPLRLTAAPGALPPPR